MTIVDSEKQVMKCQECGDTVPIPMGLLSWVCAVMDAFSNAHKNCFQGDTGKQTWFSAPKVEVTKR